MKSLMRIENLSVAYPIKGGVFGGGLGEIEAVKSVNLEILQGETLGLVGESGCGKSTLGRAILQLQKVKSGVVHFRNQEISKLSGASLRKARKDFQMIFQDPFSSLNPRMRVREILAEPFHIHRLCSSKEIDEKVANLIESVGLREDSLNKFPHEFSGGQRQRIGIARAIAVQPSFIVADEPVSALDVSIQAQILNLLKDLQKKYQLTYLFISHDLNVIRYFCDRIVVMYLGRVVEILSQSQILDSSFRKHPYTEALLAAVPSRLQRQTELPLLSGDIPSPARPPSGCVFHPRCRESIEQCKRDVPSLTQKSSLVACHLRE